jgi:hypothetical protein
VDMDGVDPFRMRTHRTTLPLEAAVSCFFIARARAAASNLTLVAQRRKILIFDVSAMVARTFRQNKPCHGTVMKNMGRTAPIRNRYNGCLRDPLMRLI